MKRHVYNPNRRARAGKSVAAWCRPVVAVLALGAVTLAEPDAAALGLRIPNQDASAIARGNAFVATADNPSAIYYNPAGITQLEGNHFQAGSLFYLGIYADYDSPSGARYSNEPEVLPVPSFQYTFTPQDCPLSFGLGLYEPFGFSVDWPEDVPFRTEGLEGSLNYFTINPVVAWKILPSLSIAAGPTFNYSKLKLAQGLLPIPNLLPGDRIEFDGNNWGYGFNFGVLWQPHEKWSFGASYRSAMTITYNGTASTYPSPPLPGGFNTTAQFNFPQIAIGGVSFRPTPDWNIEVDIDWADWSSAETLNIQGVANRPLFWRSSFMYELGVTRFLGKGYYVSAGFFFSETSTPQRYYSPLVADTDLYIGSLGGGYKGDHWSWALAVQVIGGPWQQVTVDPTAVSPTVNGSYKIFTPTLSVSLGYHF